MNTLLSLLLFMVYIILLTFFGFAYSWIGLLFINSWVGVVLGIEYLRLLRIKRKEGWLTSKERTEEIMKELRKDRRV